MLFHMKDHKAAVLENDLNKLQKDGPAAWADLPEDELLTPASTLVRRKVDADALFSQT